MLLEQLGQRDAAYETALFIHTKAALLYGTDGTFTSVAANDAKRLALECSPEVSFRTMLHVTYQHRSRREGRCRHTGARPHAYQVESACRPISA